MEGMSQSASGIAAAPRAAESSQPSTVTLSLEALKMLIQSLKPDADATQLLTQVGIIPTQPPTSETCSERTVVIKDKDEIGGKIDGPVEQGEELEQKLPGIEKSAEEPTAEEDEVMEVVREMNAETKHGSIAKVPERIQAELIYMGTTTVNAPIEEAEQPLLTPEEVTPNLGAKSSESDKTNMEVDGVWIVEWHPTERAEVTTDETPGDREVVIITDERKETNQAPPRDEDAGTRAATIHIYQWRPAREETSGKRSAEEQPKETRRQRTEGVVDSPTRSAVIPPRRRRRLLIDDELEEEEDVVFTLLDALPSSGLPAPPAEVEGSDRERRERKRKGKAIATPVKKKLKQVSSTLVI